MSSFDRQRVLVLVRSAEDAGVIREVVEQLGAIAIVCSDVSELSGEMYRGAGTVVLGEEMLDTNGIEILAQVLADQPDWSALPVLLAASQAPLSAVGFEARKQIESVQFLDRPVGLSTLQTTIEAALRSRLKQYEVRDLIGDLGRQQQALEESEKRLRALADENVRLYRAQLVIAETLQRALLHIPAVIGRLRLGHLYRSATETARVGGDFYDVFKVKDGKVAVLIGDVSGHGIEGARTALLTKDVVHAFIHQTLRPEQVFQSTNKLLLEKSLTGFVTGFLGVLDLGTGLLTHTSAGHPETLLRRNSGEIQFLGLGSAPLGVHPEASWKAGEVKIETGDLLLLYTDGIIEARRDGQFFGQERLAEALKRWAEPSPELLPQALLDEALAFSGGELRDDVAMLAIRLMGDAAPNAEEKDWRQDE